MESTDMEQGRKRFKNPKYESEESESDASIALTECNINFPEPLTEPPVNPKSSKLETVKLCKYTLAKLDVPFVKS